MGLRIGVIKSLFGSVSKKIGQETSKAPERMTRVFTDSSSGIVKMERSINRNGKEALATLEVSPNGSRCLRIEYSPGVSSERTTQITREKGASVFGGDKVTIDKVYGHNDWGDNLKLVKEYSPQGVLEHKELHYNRSIEGHWPNHAVQDRVYDEYPLSSGYRDMISDPQASRYVKHVFNKENNYFRFADGSSTNYTRAIQAKEQAAIDAAKKIEAEALAAKEAAGKATAELRAKQPRINISKALNKDINELTVKEIKLADGTIERTFTDPESGKVLAKTQDLGILHKEWVYGGKADMIYMKQVGKDEPYILAKKGNHTQIRRSDEQVIEQYYNDGSSSLKRSYFANTFCHDTTGSITVYDEAAATLRKRNLLLAEHYPDYPKVVFRNGQYDPHASQSCPYPKTYDYVKELDADAQQNFLNFDDLFSDFVG